MSFSDRMHMMRARWQALSAGMRWALGGGAGLLLLILALSGGDSAAEGAGDEPPRAQAAITVTPVTRQALSDVILASGLIGAEDEVRVQPLIEGQPIETLTANVGDQVQAGQVLATLSRSAIELRQSQALASEAAAEAQIAQAEAQVIEARAAAEEAARVEARTEKLRQGGTTSQAAADQAAAAATSAKARLTAAEQALKAARAQGEVAKAQLADAELQLTRTEVVAPVAGVIVERNALRGAIATAAGAPMFVIVRDGLLEVRAELSESDLLRVAPGQSATLKVVGAEGEITGTLRLVEPRIDAQTRLGLARIRIDDPAKVRSGMFAEAAILAAAREGLAVPLTAIGEGPDGASVMRIRDGVAERVAVRLGIRDQGFVEVLEGLGQGDLVVTKAGAFVRPGDRVTPIMDGAKELPAVGG